MKAEIKNRIEKIAVAIENNDTDSMIESVEFLKNNLAAYDKERFSLCGSSKENFKSVFGSDSNVRGMIARNDNDMSVFKKAILTVTGKNFSEEQIDAVYNKHITGF